MAKNKKKRSYANVTNFNNSIIDQETIYKEKVIGFINGYTVVTCDHGRERQITRGVDESFLLKAIALSWLNIKNIDNYRKDHIVLLANMGNIYNFVPEEIKKVNGYIHNTFKNGAKTKRMIPEYLNIRMLTKRDDNINFFVSIDKYEKEKKITVVTTMMTKKIPKIKKDSIFFDLRLNQEIKAII